MAACDTNPQMALAKLCVLSLCMYTCDVLVCYVLTTAYHVLLFVLYWCVYGLHVPDCMTRMSMLARASPDEHQGPCVLAFVFSY